MSSPLRLTPALLLVQRGLHARRSVAARGLPEAVPAGLRRPGHVGEDRPQSDFQCIQVYV